MSAAARDGIGNESATGPSGVESPDVLKEIHDRINIMAIRIRQEVCSDERENIPNHFRSDENGVEGGELAESLSAAGRLVAEILQSVIRLRLRR